MKVVALNASSRVWGNTEILLRQALASAAGEGAESRFLRLADLELKPCRGCLACVFKNRDCVLDDGLGRVLEELRWADAVILGSPTYLLGATSIVKVLQERLLRFATLQREFAGKAGLSIAVAGIEGWAPFALPQLSLTFLSLGMTVVDQFVGYGQGPGEVLWDEAALGRAARDGAALGRGESSYRGEAGTCPCCHFDLVMVGPGGKGLCTLCDLPGTWSFEDGGAVFTPQIGAEPRWSERRARSHFEEKLLPSGERFRSHMGEIRQRMGALKREWARRDTAARQ